MGVNGGEAPAQEDQGGHSGIQALGLAGVVLGTERRPVWSEHRESEGRERR